MPLRRQISKNIFLFSNQFDSVMMLKLLKTASFFITLIEFDHKRSFYLLLHFSRNRTTAQESSCAKRRGPKRLSVIDFNGNDEIINRRCMKRSYFGSVRCQSLGVVELVT